MRNIVLFLACGALVAGGLLAGDAEAAERRGRRLHRHGAMRALRAIDALGATDAQKALLLEKARAAQPVVDAARKEAAGTLAKAYETVKAGGDRRAAREAARASMRSIRERTRAQLEPLARAVLESLTPEQRQKIAGRAAARGGSFDEGRFVRRLGRMLARPMTVALLESR